MRPLDAEPVLSVVVCRALEAHNGVQCNFGPVCKWTATSSKICSLLHDMGRVRHEAASQVRQWGHVAKVSAIHEASQTHLRPGWRVSLYEPQTVKQVRTLDGFEPHGAHTTYCQNCVSSHSFANSQYHSGNRENMPPFILYNPAQSWTMSLATTGGRLSSASPPPSEGAYVRSYRATELASAIFQNRMATRCRNAQANLRHQAVVWARLLPRYGLLIKEGHTRPTVAC